MMYLLYATIHNEEEDIQTLCNYSVEGQAARSTLMAHKAVILLLF